MTFIGSLKKAFYFPVAYYFRFLAKIKLARWKPRIVVITGSTAKTTTMTLIESQLGDKAFYSHHANSAYGIPFSILGLARKTLFPSEWVGLFLLAPIKAFSKTPNQNLYIIEADCDRPGEGRFLSTLLNPEVTIWLTTSATHAMNFDYLVSVNKFKNVEEAIAAEYGYFLEKTSKVAIVNSDSSLINNQLDRTNARVIKISEKEHLNAYKVSVEGTEFKIKNKRYVFKALLPKASFSSVLACLEMATYLGIQVDGNFSKFELPPGRSNVFKGIKNTTIIDSTYNTGLAAMTVVLAMFGEIQADKKWVILGDILEAGRQEREEHEKLAQEIIKAAPDRIILMGPRISKYTYPVLSKHFGLKIPLVHFHNPKDVLTYLENNISGNELLLFKGARFLEGVIEHLLADKNDVSKLPRREKIWKIRRKKWGL